MEAAVGVLNRACARAPSWSELRWPPAYDPAADDPAGDEPTSGRPVRVTRSAHDPALAAVAAIAEEAVALFAGPDRRLLRACRAPGCVLYFVRNHPRREWCSDGCGNRARVARHYQRHHGGG
ncbi:CGNR zinc finger domain-containing protein [Dactylosporangium aurantiacum]|uniref:CGNR zinc finger domain-containing protein n=1 Tax=Dactylosporangium aurantiacum TaxID=35754 RepID=A0A9Q9IQ11_9ACTN|nr:CGNR zinc finger domain-containing protein [Dactylosporangium aurantiacum]